MTESSDPERTHRVRYAARLDRELERAVVRRRDGESVIVEGVVRSGRLGSLKRLSYLRVSEQRICLLEHYAFRPDALTEIPIGAEKSVAWVDGSYVRLVIGHEAGGKIIWLRPWEKRLRRLTVEPKVVLSSGELFELLQRLCRGWE